MTVNYCRLHASEDKHVEDLQRLLEAAPDYHLLVDGCHPAPGAATRVLTILPPRTSITHKYTFGIRLSEKLIGCLDVIRGYPNPDTAFIGLLLFLKPERGKSRGVQALHYIENLAAEWRCNRLRLAVIDTNTRALAFWKREGFVELHRKPSDRHTGDAIVMERAIRVTYNRCETKHVSPDRKHLIQIKGAQR